MLAANNTPDFRTISDFRKDNVDALSGLFVQVLALCQQAGLVKLGHVALDGTKVKANASKHKAMSYQRMKEKAAQLAAEVAELLRQAQTAMETACASIILRCSNNLQWGHRLSAMETCSARLTEYSTFLTFNGATAFRRWKRLCSTSRAARWLVPFNGATAFRRWKPLFVARLRHGFMQKRSFPQESVTG